MADIEVRMGASLPTRISFKYTDFLDGTWGETVAVGAPLPAGTNTIGTVGVDFSSGGAYTTPTHSAAMHNQS